jgi:hypothetical protein
MFKTSTFSTLTTHSVFDCDMLSSASRPEGAKHGFQRSVRKAFPQGRQGKGGKGRQGKEGPYEGPSQGRNSGCEEACF